jgi:hypothetical protein
MAARLHPEFHAEVIKELYGEIECYQLVTERTRLLLRGYSPEHLEAVRKYLPKHLLGVLPSR